MTKCKNKPKDIDLVKLRLLVKNIIVITISGVIVVYSKLSYIVQDVDSDLSVVSYYSCGSTILKFVQDVNNRNIRVRHTVEVVILSVGATE